MNLNKTAEELGIAPVALQELICSVLTSKGLPNANEPFLWDDIPPQYQNLIDEFKKFSHIPLWWTNYSQLVKEHQQNQPRVMLNLKELSEKLADSWYSAELLDDSPIRKCWEKGAKDPLLFPVIEQTFEASVLFALNELANTNVGREVLLKLVEYRLK